MARLTVAPSDDLHQALQETAARRRRTIGEPTEEGLRFHRIERQEDVGAPVAAARTRSGIVADEAVELAVRETAAARLERDGRRPR